MNYTEFSFIVLVKLNIKILFFGNEHLLSQVHNGMSLDSSLGEIQQVFVTLFELIKTESGNH